ncbi:MAG TPA: HEAT repeat domain-containing protein [Syntrophales bacterium]|nr:HEAT repeat domain-containing protein [Syntrophales bacterium]HOX94266.1 HEAT repeat domain-containing protein [Syntrophales bacterium]HPI58179.1 HEAT repeat domain-containing protein [Syntrophales bacterium]HPN26017.1 HEAT repeat domain-containing protein [Syntrophales bacterium]HQM30330.1 HEAT repeat domain-containing protein [Syntrophales bacterium]
MRFGKSRKDVTQAAVIILLIVPFLLCTPAVNLMAQTGSAADQKRDALITDLKDPDKKIRIWAAEQLGNYWDKAIVPPLITALKDPEPSVRAAAAKSLGNLSDRGAVQPLIAALKDPDPSVRAAAAGALGNLNDKAAVPPLIVALRDRDRNVRVAATESLGYLGHRAAVRPLVTVLKDGEPSVRAAAAGALGNLSDRTAVPPLIAALKDADKGVRLGAAEALGKLGDRTAVRPLIAALKDPEPSVRAAAAKSLGNLSDRGAVQPLIAALKDHDPSVRAGAAWALGKLGDKAAVRPLIAALKDPEPSVRAAATGSLGKLGDQAAVPALVEVMKTDSARYIRCEAVMALEGLKYMVSYEYRRPCYAETGSAGPGPPPPHDPKGGGKAIAFWNTWFENRDEKSRAEVLKKDKTYTFVLDISKYPYFRDSKAEPDPSVIKSIDEARKEGKSSIRFRIRPIFHGGFLRFTDNQRAWEELKVDIDRLVLADKATEENNEKKKVGLSSGEIKLQDFAHEVQAGEVRFDVTAERAGNATILITIWDEKGMIPLDHLSMSVRVIDEPVQAGGRSPAGAGVFTAPDAAPSAAAGGRPVSDTVPLRQGRQTLLNVSSDFSTAGPLIADAAFYIFEKSPRGKSVVLFAAKTADAAPGAPDEVSVYAWETLSLLSNYIEDRLQLIKLIRDARQRAASLDENVRKYSYQEAAKELKEKMFSGLSERDEQQAAAAEKAFRDLVQKKDRRAIVFARMRNEGGNPVYLPLGLLAANSSSRILDKRIILVQPLPRERYPAETYPVQTWTFNVPNTLQGLEDPAKGELGKLQQNPPYRRDMNTVRSYFEASVPAAAVAAPEGVILLSHQAGGNLWFTNDADRITAEKIKRQFPAGSVAILSACSAAASEGNNQAILERLNSNGIDAMIISPFPVDAEYGAMLAIEFVQAIEAARKNSQAFSLAELFTTASEQTARHFKEKQKINFEDMDLEFLIAGDYRIRIAPK